MDACSGVRIISHLPHLLKQTAHVINNIKEIVIIAVLQQLEVLQLQTEKKNRLYLQLLQLLQNAMITFSLIVSPPFA